MWSSKRIEMAAECGPVPAEALERARAAWPERGVAKRKTRRSA
jgi:GTP cyclohydrolase III